LTLNALTVDVEEYFQVSNFEHVIPRSRWDTLESRVERSTRTLLDLFEETDQRATFFTLGWVAERHPRLIQEISARGHEVACHGYEHRLVYELGPTAFREDLRKGRQAVENAAGCRVVGYRAPSYSITRDSLWALDVLADEGFEFDSSIFPIRHHRYGIPDFATQPVELQLSSGRRLREFPATTLTFGRVRIPLSGGAYLRFLPPALFRWNLSRCERQDTPSMLYLHPWEIDPDQPRQPVSRKVRVNHYFNLDRTQARIRALLHRFRFAAMGDVLRELQVQRRMPIRDLGLLEAGL
jgi:polysaccharide deacetylase family protein (PEP-CTERM system associated)